MKVILAVLVILPLAFAIPDKRLLLGPLFPGDELRSLVSQLVTLAGSEETEHKCEIDCHSLVQHNTLLQHGCPLVCRSLQSLAHHFGIQHPRKRLLLDTLFQGDELKNLVSQLVATAGSEETEHKCETECHALIQQSHLLQFACPLVCKSLQSLAHRFGFQHPRKRLLLDTLFQGDELKNLVSQLVATAGSEETEHKCETECHALIQQSHLLQFACPLVCKSLQSLAHRFGFQHPSKRSLLDTLFQGDELKNLVSHLLATAGSEETEHKCETECHALIQQSHLLQFACPLVCKSLQSLAHRFGFQHPSKRSLLDTLFQGDELKNLVSHLLATAGSEETEHKCETECHALIQQSHLLQFACPLVCKSLQSLAHRFGFQHPSKRSLLDTLFQGDELKNLVSQLVATAGSEETEHKCETECHALIQQSHLLQFACPLVCKSLQSLAHRFGFQHPSKRLLLDTLFQGDELKNLVSQLVATAGSEETEHKCETECHALIQQSHLLQFACPLVCKSLQSLAHRFGFQHPSKRLLILDTLFQGDELKNLVSHLLATAGSEETEHKCETECHALIQQSHLLQFACPLVCKSLQSLAHRFGFQHPSKRLLILDTLFQGDELKNLVSHLLATAGSEETEHKCETECHALIQQSHLLQFACPLVCKSLQSLAHRFGFQHPSKRSLLDTLFQGDELKNLVSQLVATAGSEETEHKCETECHALIQQSHLLQFACPLVCKSLQSLAHRFGIQHPSKRSLVDTLFQGDELKSLVTKLVAMAGSDETEHQCEVTCHSLVQQDHLLQFACPLVCKSLQSLAHRFGIQHPRKRFLLDTLFQGDELKNLVSQLVGTAGSEETEHKCETECHALIQQDHLLQFACPLVCKSLQSLAHRFGIPHPSTHSKRLIVDTLFPLFQGDELKSLVSQLVATAGSEETEHKCETECHALVQQNHLLQHGCPLVCRSLQTLAHHFGIPHPSTHSKRLFIDTLFQGDELKSLVSQLVATAGSEETEHKCETECHALVQQNHLLQFACPLVCKSLQSLAHRFGIQHPRKRFLLDTLFQGDELKSLVTQLVALVGSDETEHQCEMACHSLLQHNNLLQFACPLVCKSLQSLAQRFGIPHQSTDAKRLLLDTLFQGDELKSLVSTLISLAGSEETEHKCETECHSLVQQNHLLQHGCPLICRSLQSLAHSYGISHPNVVPHKRLLLDTLLQGVDLKVLLTQMASTLASDSTEIVCESRCHHLIQTDHLLQFGCPLICKSFQRLVHRLGIHAPVVNMPSTTATPTTATPTTATPTMPTKMVS